MSSTLYVDLSRIAHNLGVISDQVGKNIKKMAVVKDDAYGHGAVQVARHLEGSVDYFCVAKLAEAIELRESGIKKPILVFEIPPLGSEHLYKEHDITTSISDLSVFDRLEDGTQCHLHFDTGMFRLGMLPEQAESAREKMKEFDKLNYTGIYTHFANSDDPGHERVLRQLEVFKSIRPVFPDHLMTHACNSGGLFFYGEEGTYFDAVRFGVSLFGYAPGETEIRELKPAVKWVSHLVQVKKLNKGDAVGYGSRWTAPEEGWLGTIPVGYADGVFRTLSGKIHVEIAGQLYQQVGTISMDYMTVYLGKDRFEQGEPVVILRNGKLSAKEWARIAGTIPYEITTTIHPKVKREYNS
ncbi:MAG: alanine racemase [Gracilimonas sp.]|uniref:alanine racemase n=1 Tax=Gracilimonas TaxID=649462 RepID=UPI001B0E2D8D|nr:alanine racemase [Gracilimonas sp.]MBO6586594.1 alanine racemase [Gracilimonas sp.]MBO6615251.1 alanine racemase [Gracilimonas sp.]